MWHVNPWYNTTFEPLLFAALAVVSFCLRRRPRSPVVWFPATLYWIWAAFYVWVQVHMVTVTGWFGEALFNLLLYAARVLTLASLGLCAAGAPRRRPHIASFAGGAALLAAVVLLPRALLHYIEAQRYVFVATDSQGHPVPHFSIIYTYIDPEGEKVPGHAEGDDQGRATVTVYGQPDLAFSAPGAMAEQHVCIVGRTWVDRRWTAVVRHNGKEIRLGQIATHPENPDGTVSIQFQTAADYEQAVLYRELKPDLVASMHESGWTGPLASRYWPGLLLLDNGEQLLDCYAKDPAHDSRPAMLIRHLLDVLQDLGKVNKDDRSKFLASLGTYDNQPRTLSGAEQDSLRDRIRDAQRTLGKHPPDEPGDPAGNTKMSQSVEPASYLR